METTDASEGDVRRELEELRKRFAGTTRAELEKGGWLADLVAWTLKTHAEQVDADYIRRHYAGIGPSNQAEKAINLAVRAARIAGAASGAAASAAELATPVLGPLAIGGVVAVVGADVTYTTRLQLRAIYDLSVIRGAPLSMHDAEDCHFILLSALGVKLTEATGDFIRVAGPKVIAYNMRRLLRSGLRKAIVEVLRRLIGSLARRITERALMRILVPGLNVPLSAWMNGRFTAGVLRTADRALRTRAALVRPVLTLHREAPDLAPQHTVRAIIAVLAFAHGGENWPEAQMNALRQVQSALALDDEAIGALDDAFESAPSAVAAHFAGLTASAREALTALLVAALAIGHDATDARGLDAAALITGRTDVAVLRAALAECRARLV